MTFRTRHIGTAFISAVGIFCVSIAPIIPQLHQAFTDHNHVYCPEHHRIEDAGSKPRGFRHLAAAFPSGSLKSGTRAVDAGSALRLACEYSNFQVHFQPSYFSPRPASEKAEEEQVGSLENAGGILKKVLLFAPKHSPPVQLSKTAAL